MTLRRGWAGKPSRSWKKFHKFHKFDFLGLCQLLEWFFQNGFFKKKKDSYASCFRGEVSEGDDDRKKKKSKMWLSDSIKMIFQFTLW